MPCTSRRNFIRQSSSALAATAFLPAFSRPVQRDIIRIGIIGMGSRGTGLATLLKKISGFKVIACCDLLAQNLNTGIKSAAPDAKPYTEYRRLLEDRSIDAVIIATPLYLHASMAVAALEAGKHVYLEKSMTYSIDEALLLTQLVNDHKSLVFQVGYQYRYYGLYKKVKEIIRQNWLGKVTHVECQYNRNSNWRNPVADPGQERIINWRMYKEFCGGPLSELCAHQIDMIDYLFDARPNAVTGMGGINYWKDGRTTFDHIRALYEYPSGMKASINSVLSNAFNGYNIKIYGDKATVEIQREDAFIYAESLNNEKGIVDGVTGASISVTTQGKAEKIKWLKPGEQLLEPTTYALTDFRDCILRNRKPLSGIDNGRNSSIAIHMGNTAAETGMIQHWQSSYSL